MVRRAILALKSKRGSSTKSIVRYICAHFNVKKTNATKAVGRALKRMLRSGLIYRSKVGSYKLTGKGRTARRPDAPVAVRRPARRPDAAERQQRSPENLRRARRVRRPRKPKNQRRLKNQRRPVRSAAPRDPVRHADATDASLSRRPP